MKSVQITSLKNLFRFAVFTSTVLTLFAITEQHLSAKDLKAFPYDIAGKTVHLGLPDNNCKLNPEIASDKMLMDGVQASVKGVNELMLHFAECQQLTDWRNSKQTYLDNYGSYQTSLRFKNIDLSGREAESIKGICAVFKKQGAAILEKVKPEMNKEQEGPFKNIKINEVKILGIVKDEKDICAIAMFQKLKTQNDTIKDQINVYSITILNGRMIFSYLYAPWSDNEVVEQLTSQITALNQFNQQQNK